MSRNKFSLKDKKTKIIISVIALCIILLGGLGFGLATLNSTESKDIAYNKDKVDKNKTENKKEDSKKEESKKEESKKENKKEESKKEETKKEETKVETSSTTSEGTSSVENKSEGNKGTSNSSTNTGSSSSSSSSSNSSNSGVTNKPSTGGSSSSNSGSSNSNSGAVSTPSTPSKPSTGSSSSGSSSSGNTSKPEAHTHSWNPITTTVHHDEVGHWEDVLIQEAWTEYIPVYDEVGVLICNGCGADISTNPHGHLKEQMLAGNMQCSGFSTDYKQVQVGTEEIKHGPVYDMKYVVDTPAWDETVTTGYQCSCGATK